MARVLLVEDDAPTRESMAEILAVYGHDVRSAETAGQAHRLLVGSVRRFDVVVTDVVLPGGSFSILEHAHGQHMPVIMMTGHFEPAVRQRALRQGAFAFLKKPVTGREIDRIVGYALAASRSRQRRTISSIAPGSTSSSS